MLPFFVLLLVFLELIIALLFPLLRFPSTKSHALQQPLSAVIHAGKHIILSSLLTTSSVLEWCFSQSVAQTKISWVFSLLSFRESPLPLSLISGITEMLCVIFCNTLPDGSMLCDASRRDSNWLGQTKQARGWQGVMDAG